MVHACGVKHVARQDTLVEYVKCMMEDNYNPMQVCVDLIQCINVRRHQNIGLQIVCAFHFLTH